MSTPVILPKIELWIRNTQVRGRPVDGASWVYLFEWRDVLGAPRSACLIKRPNRPTLYHALLVSGVPQDLKSTYFSADQMTAEVLEKIAVGLVKKAEEVIRAAPVSDGGSPVLRVSGVTVGDAFDDFIAATKSKWSPDYLRAQSRRARYVGAILGTHTRWAALEDADLTRLVTALRDGFEGESRQRNGTFEKRRIKVGYSDAIQIVSLISEVHSWLKEKKKAAGSAWGVDSPTAKVESVYGRYIPEKHYISNQIADRIAEALVDIQAEDEGNRRTTAQWERFPAPRMYATLWEITRELGYRIESVCTLQLGDILAPRDAALVARGIPEFAPEWSQLADKWPHGAIFIPAERTKTEMDTLLPITPRLHEILGPYLATRPKDAPETLFYGPNRLTSSLSRRARGSADAPCASFLNARLSRAWDLANKRYGATEMVPARRKGEGFRTLRRLKATNTDGHSAAARALAQGWDVNGGGTMPQYYAGKTLEGVYNAAAGKSPAHSAIQAAEERAERAEERARVAEERAQQAAKQAADATALAQLALQRSKQGQPSSRRRKRR